MYTWWWKNPENLFLCKGPKHTKAKMDFMSSLHLSEELRGICSEVAATADSPRAETENPDPVTIHGFFTER